MSIHTGRNGDIVFKKESSWGSYVAGDVMMRAATESLERKVEHEEDPALVKESFTTDMIKISDGASGGIELKLHPDVTGILLKGALGGEDSVGSPVNGYIIINYTGSIAYARLTISTNIMTAETSIDGTTWINSVTFNSGNTIDLTNASFDTLAELATAIDGYADWTAQYFGLSSAATNTIGNLSATKMKVNGSKVGAVVLTTKVAGSTAAKVHTLYPSDTSTNLPSYSFTVNRTAGTNKSLGYVGSKINSLTLQISAKTLVSASLAISCKAEEVDKNDISLTVPTLTAFKAANTSVMLDDLLLDELKDFTLTLSNNVDETGVVGSDYIVEQIRQGATLEVSFTCNMTDNIYAQRSKYIADTPVEMIIYMKSDDYCDSTNQIPYSMLIRLNRVKLKQFSAPLSGPDRITITGSGTVVKPTGTGQVTEHMYSYVTDNLLSTY